MYKKGRLDRARLTFTDAALDYLKGLKKIDRGQFDCIMGTFHGLQDDPPIEVTHQFLADDVVLIACCEHTIKCGVHHSPTKLRVTDVLPVAPI